VVVSVWFSIVSLLLDEPLAWLVAEPTPVTSLLMKEPTTVDSPDIVSVTRTVWFRTELVVP
jgi:hypothetical protein